MDLSYSLEQEMLRESAFRVVRESYDFDTRKRHLAEPCGFSAAMWKQFAELGWMGLPIAEDDGGFGGDWVDLSIIMEALGSVLAAEPYLATVVLGTGALSETGNATQRQLLRKVAEGELLLAFAYSESGCRGDLKHCRTRAERCGDAWVLNGEKQLVLGAAGADHLIVSARLSGDVDDRRGIGLFLVPKSTDGLEIADHPLLDGCRAADVRLRRVEITGDSLIGGNADAIGIIEKLVDWAIIASCFYVLGGMDILVRDTCAFTQQRIQFGQPIGKFQVVQHRLAEMQVMCREARAAALFATLRATAPDQERARAAAAAKVKVGQAARFVACQAVQLHGGMGVSEELNIGTYLKHVTVFNQLFGSVSFHLRRYQAQLMNGDFQVKDGLVRAQF